MLLYLHYSGGNSSNGDVSTVEMYDDENGKWKSMPSLNETRSHFNAIM